MPRPRRARPASFSPLLLLLRVAAWLFGAWLVGFVVFLVAAFTASPPNPLPPADGIVALTGGDERISTALALLADHEAPLMLISGAGRGTYLGDFTADDAAAITRYAASITLGHKAASTHGNAVEAAAWARAHHMHSLIIVTADYHMPRAMQEMRNAMPEMELIPAPVRPPAMRKLATLQTLRLLAGEYTKFLAVWVGLGPAGDGATNEE
jgi:uncharacterized SAM-binding protein YcdF (DUF218 family)